MAKYATFMKPEDFGSQFFMGSIVTRQPEYPLHFLQGIWGSAFSILIHRGKLEKLADWSISNP